MKQPRDRAATRPHLAERIFDLRGGGYPERPRVEWKRAVSDLAYEEFGAYVAPAPGVPTDMRWVDLAEEVLRSYPDDALEALHTLGGDEALRKVVREVRDRMTASAKAARTEACPTSPPTPRPPSTK